MNIGVHVSLSDLVSSVCTPRSGIAGSYGSSISRRKHFQSHRTVISAHHCCLYTCFRTFWVQNKDLLLLYLYSACACLAAQSCLTLLWPHGLQPARLLCPWDFPGKNTGVGYHFFIQGIFPFPGTEPASPALAGWFVTTEPPGKPALYRTV